MTSYLVKFRFNDKSRYALPYAAPHVAYAHAPVVYAHPIDSGLVYPVAEPYVHDATGELYNWTETTERQRDRETERQRDRETERQKDRKRERQKYRETK